MHLFNSSFVFLRYAVPYFLRKNQALSGKGAKPWLSCAYKKEDASQIFSICKLKVGLGWRCLQGYGDFAGRLADLHWGGFKLAPKDELSFGPACVGL